MRRYRLPVAVGASPSEVEIRGRDHHYLARVLRLDVGDDIDVVDPQGRPGRARVVRRETDTLVLEARAADVPQPALTWELHLFPCLPKGRKMDIIVRQATEAGVVSITPVRSERAIGEPSPQQVERWSRIAIEALQQCGRAFPPRIHEPVDLGVLAATEQGARDIFFHEDVSYAEPLHRILCPPVGSVRVLVGPEGGLSVRETAHLRETGWRQAWLGPTVLRSETAAIAAVTAVTIVLLESDAWRPRTTDGPGSSTYPSTP